MKTLKNIRRICALAAVFLLVVALMPLTALAETDIEIPVPPYEKTLYQSGNWYLEYLGRGDDIRAVVGYRGSWERDPKLQNETSLDPIPVNIKADSFITAIHVPYSYAPELDDLAQVNAMVYDSQGNEYGPYVMTPYLVQGEGKPTVTTDDQGNQVITDPIPQDIYVRYAVSIDEGLLVEKGTYYIHTTDNSRILRNGQTGAAGAVMVVGVDYDAWMKYMDALAALEAPIPHDFTGRYSIDFQALKTSTLMGPVSPPTVGLSLNEFELAVLDQGDIIQLVGKYEGIPFSQMCEVIERTDNWVSANMGATMDLTKLPYKAKIGGIGVIVLSKAEDQPGTIEFMGEGTFERAASADKGADSNTYDLNAKGKFAGKDLPAYVVAALAGRMPGAAGVPGPDTPLQGAIGALFPPLIAVIGNAVQSSLIKQDQEEKAKKAAKAAKEAKSKKASGQRDKDWYKRKYPGKTDEQIAMIMLADAMGNTDNPDDDPFSIGDNEGGEASSGRGASGDGDSWGQDQEEDSYQGDDQGQASDEEYGEAQGSESKGDTESSADPGKPEEETAKAPVEPETRTVQIDAKGNTIEIQKDPVTGEWVNTETGNTFDPEIQKTAEQGWEKDREAIAKNKEVNDESSSEWDKKLRDDNQARKDQIVADNVKAKIMQKYGLSPGDDAQKIIGKSRDADAAVAKAYIRAGNVAQTFETGAKVTVAIADAAVDGLGNATGPVGRGIRAGYKVAKGVAETTANQGLSWQNVGSGLVKGGMDAGTDFTNPKWSPNLQKAVKTGLQISGEIVGETTSSKGKGFVEGLKSGVTKVVLDNLDPSAAVQGYGGDLVTKTLKNGQVRVAVNNAGKWGGRTVTKTVATVFESQKNNKQLLQTGAKAVVNLTNEFAVKPMIG
jgi:hypothetical protein